MSASRWTTRDRILFRDGVPLVRVARWQRAEDNSTNIPPHEMDELIRRVVDLLNATGLSDTAAAMLQAVVMEAATNERDAQSAMISGFPDEDQQARLATLDNLTDVLNHAVRVYVVLDTEPTLKIGQTTGGDNGKR